MTAMGTAERPGAVTPEWVERFRAIEAITGDWFWEIDLDGRHTYTNQAVTAILGYAPEELLARDVLELIVAEDRPKAEALLAECVVARRGWTGAVLRWRHREGGTRWLESTAVPIIDGEGRLRGFRGSDRDITRRVRTELALREAFALAANERARAESILAALPDGVSI
jgi:PAS domain S-box-containing protein